MNSLRFALRQLAKNPGFALVTVLTLALGLGANTTIFSMISAFFFDPLPVKDADRLVLVLQKSELWNMPHGQSWLDYEDYRDQVTEFEDALALFMSPVHLGTAGRPADRTWIEAVSGNYFTMLGIGALQGRTLQPEDTAHVGANPVAVLGYHYWLSHFGGNPDIVGQTIQLNGQPFEVVGVADPSFNGAQWAIRPSAWVPATMMGQLFPNGEELLTERGAPAFKVMARLKPGARFTVAQAAVEGVAAQLAREYPDAHRNARVFLRPEQHCRPEPTFSEFMPFASLVFMGLVGLVLFIACANVANLMLSRALARQKEMAIRTAVGASRGQLIRQLLLESVVIAVIAGGVGMALAEWAGSLISGFAPGNDIPLNTDQDWHWTTPLFTVALAVVAGVATGLAPALRATSVNVVSSLKEGTAPVLASVRHRFRDLLVVAQVALSLVVLVCGAIFLQTLRAVAQTDLGFRTERLLTASIDLGLQGYGDTQGLQFLDRLLERTKGLPGVESASVAMTVPFDYGFQIREVGAEGQISEGPPGQDGFVTGAGNHVSEDYFQTLGITLMQGRHFNRWDDEEHPMVAIVNRTLAERFWPDQEPLGKRLRFGRDGDWLEIVGVAQDGKYVMIGEEPRPFIYVPLAQHYRSPITLHLRTTGDPLALAPALRRAIAALDPDLPIYNLRTMDHHVRESAFGLMPLRLGATVAGVQGLLGLALAIMGLYGVVAYAVTQRTREIGIRMALGARRIDVFRLVIGEGWRLALFGLGSGLAIAVVLALGLSRLLYGFNPMNAPVFAGVVLLLCAVALLACYLPARRAMRVDPVVALRAE